MAVPDLNFAGSRVWMALLLGVDGGLQFVSQGLQASGYFLFHSCLFA